MKIITTIFLFLVLLFPLSAKAQSPIAPATDQPVTEEEARRFMDEYKARMMGMDIDAFMDLFSKEAIENRTIFYDDIRQAYGRAFASSNAIEYRLLIYSVDAYPKSAVIRGRYDLAQSFKVRRKNAAYQGDIQWTLIRENGSLKIKEINYGRDH
jgi:hypothetical protein